MIRFSRPCVALWLAALIAAPAAGTAGEPPENLDAYFNNAAVHYWKAVTKLQPILDEKDLKAVIFIENRLPNLPPRAFIYRQDVGKWLLKERRMLTDLSVASAQPFCVFNPRTESTMPPDLSHRAVLPDVWRRALACAKAFEFVDNHSQATTIYLDLLKLFDNLDEDHDWASAFYAINQVPEILLPIISYASRKPPREELTRIVEYFKHRESPQFPMRSYFRKEMRTYAKWLLDESETLERKIEALYKKGGRMPALEALGGLAPQEKRSILIQWLDEYQQEVVALATALEQPYAEAIPEVQKLDRRIRRLAETPAAENPNYLLPLLMPPMEQTYQQILAAEASYTLVHMVVLAAAYRDFVGEWPETYSILETFGGAELSPNPFTGEPLSYDVRRDVPEFGMEAPGWLQSSGLVLAVDLRKIMTRQLEELGKLEEEIEQRDEAAREAAARTARRSATAVPAGKADSELSARPRRSSKSTR